MEFDENYDFEESFDEDEELSVMVPSNLEEDEEVEKVERVPFNEPPARIEIVDTMPEDVKSALKTFNEILDYSREEDKKTYELMSANNDLEDADLEDDLDFGDSYEENEDLNEIEQPSKALDEDELNDFF